jgi:6-pyruvoyltetrahydropterin/6-carboxytetrahydropterin synthase
MITEIEIEDTIEAAHQLNLPYESKCNTLHGHSYRVRVKIEAKELNGNGMVIDFTDVKKVIRMYDHQNLNNFFSPTTAERFAQVLYGELAIVLSEQDNYAIITEVAVSETKSTWVKVRGQ